VLIQAPERRGRPEKGARSGHINGHKSRDDIAALFKVGKNLIQQARALVEEAPDRAAQVDDDKVSMKEAWEPAWRPGSSRPSSTTTATTRWAW
jgi:hypothetical protein